MQLAFVDLLACDLEEGHAEDIAALEESGAVQEPMGWLFQGVAQGRLDWSAPLPNGYQISRMSSAVISIMARHGHTEALGTACVTPVGERAVGVEATVLALLVDGSWVVAARASPERIRDVAPSRASVSPEEHWILDTCTGRSFGPLDAETLPREMSRLGVSATEVWRPIGDFRPPR